MQQKLVKATEEMMRGNEVMFKDNYGIHLIFFQIITEHSREIDDLKEKIRMKNEVIRKQAKISI
jgi:hypothetical protein